jgi:hypothetical protein
MTTVTVLKEAIQPGHSRSGWHLALQLAEFTHSDGKRVKGYRFICQNGSNELKAEPRIHSLADAEELIRLAKTAGWGSEKG